jgi:uracil-DNA glycosylase family 4
MQMEFFRTQRLTSNVVESEGSTTSKICFIGEAPGAEEDRGLRPFLGSAGQLLMNCFRQVGITRNEVLLNNVFCQRPPNNDVGYFFYDKSCTKPTPEGLEHIERLEQWLQGLLRLRASSGCPNVLVALGAVPLRVLTGLGPIGKYRGSILPCTLVEGFKVYGSYHPSYVSRLMSEPEANLYRNPIKKKQQKNALPIFLMDLQRVLEEAEYPEIIRPRRDVEIISNMDHALKTFRLLAEAPTISVDIETLPSSTGPMVWCIGFSDKPERSFVFPIIKDFSFFWTLEEEAAIWREVSEIFLNPFTKKTFQNGSYDLSILGRSYGLRVANNTYEDTMLCHQMIYPYMPKGLDFLCSVYTKEPYYKDEGKVWDGRRISDTAEFLYNGKDCCVTREIMPILRYSLKKHRMEENYRKTLKVFPSILRMQIRGVRIDLKKKEELTIYFNEKAQTALETLTKKVGRSFNMNSPKQMNQLLYGVLDLPVQYNSKTQRASADKDAINKLKRKVSPDSNAGQILECISTFRESSKLASTYAEMAIDYDERVRTSYGWISTFRLSSSESHFGTGGNLQNIPKRTEEGKLIRQLFIPDEGLVFLSADLRQAEAQEVAWLCDDETKMNLFKAGYDVHWHNAKLIFRIPESMDYDPKFRWQDPITGDEHYLYVYRNIGKAVIHASNYKMGPIMLQTILAREGFFLSQTVCKRLLANVLSNSPLLERWHRNTIEEVKANRRLETALGDVREFFGRLDNSLFRSAIAFRPQSVVGRLLQLAIQDIHENIQLAEPLLNVHDEVLVQCREEDLDEVKAQVRRAMEIPHRVNNHMLTIPTDFKWGYNWGELKDF